METFNDIYNKRIMIKYNPPRNPHADKMLLNSITQQLPQYQPVHHTTSFEEVPCYTIDPAGCLDADDGWSIIETGHTVQLAIHIADPTSYINLESELFSDMLKRTCTHYPSNKTPIHMMPKELMEMCSLTENVYGKIKRAVTLLINLDDNFKPTGIVKLFWSTVTVSKETEYTYESAAQELRKANTFNRHIKLALNVSKQMREARKSVGKKLAYLNSSTIQYKGDAPILKQTSPNVQLIKEMIAEFAIFFNTYIGHVLKNSLGGLGIFRMCDTSSWFSTIPDDISPDELMERIIRDGITAEYMNEAHPHDLVGAPEYCHFTSPIRRVADCVCHYLVKYVTVFVHEGYACPFTTEQIDYIAKRCHGMAKRNKKIQFSDIKFRTIQALYNMSLTQPIPINIRITGYTGLFLNCIITHIGGHKVSLSYVLRLADYPYTEFIKEFPEALVSITKVNFPENFDEGTLPELDDYLRNPKHGL